MIKIIKLAKLLVKAMARLTRPPITLVRQLVIKLVIRRVIELVLNFIRMQRLLARLPVKRQVYQVRHQLI